MSIFPISSLTSNYLQPLFNSALQTAGATANKLLGSAAGSSVTPQPDNGQLSPFAQIMSQLQKVQQSNPSQYKQVTQQIATNLQSAAQTAQLDGHTIAANQLKQLASDFSSASQGGQLPNVQDLAQAIGGHHHHHFHSAPASSDANSAGTGTAGNASTSSAASQFLSAFQGTQSEATNATSIILNTLSGAGF